MLPHVKGELATKHEPLGATWMDWEERLTRGLFGLLDDDGRRIIQTAYVEMPKKTGKSLYAAGLSVYAMTLDGEYGGEIYSVAYTVEQSKVVWKLGKAMVDRDASLAEPLGLADELVVKDYRNEIECPATGSVWTPLSREVRSKHGFNPSLLIFDELHTQKDADMWNAAQDSMGARSQPLLFAITNAGFDRESVCYRQREYAIRVNNGDIDDPSFLGLIYGAGNEDDWQEPATWRKAHPGLGVTVSADWMHRRCEKAKAIPSEQNKFQRWQLSIWTGSETRYIKQESWDACSGEVDEDALEGMKCYSGIDLATVEDVAAMVHVFPLDDNTYAIVPRFWIPGDAIIPRSRDHGVPYMQWQREGFVIVTPGPVIDYASIENTIREDAGKFNIVECAYDRWQANQLVQRLGEDGEKLTTFVGFGQGFQSMSQPTKDLHSLVLQKKIAHGGNPVLRWMCDNMMVKIDPAGNVKPDKKASSEKIDGMVALIMAMGRALVHREQRESIYKTRGIVRI